MKFTNTCLELRDARNFIFILNEPQHRGSVAYVDFIVTVCDCADPMLKQSKVTATEV